MVQEVNSKFWVTWPGIAQSVYFLREMCLFFNFWMIKFTIMCFFDIHTWNFSSKVLYMSKNHNSFKKYTNWAKLSHFWGKCVFWHVEDPSKVVHGQEKFNVWFDMFWSCKKCLKKTRKWLNLRSLVRFLGHRLRFNDFKMKTFISID